MVRPDWENECVSKSALIEWLRPYLHTGEPIPADVLISDIQMMLLTLTPPNEWISVEDRLPDSQADVLVVAFWHENWQTMIGWHSDTGKKWRVITPHGEMEPGGVTHWMPLPEAPDSRPPEGKDGDANHD